MASSQGRFLKQVWVILIKELRVEARTKEILYTTLLFGVLIVVIFAFGFVDRKAATQAAPGVLWTSMLFAGTVSINRSFEREREGNCMAGLMLVPGTGLALFFGKFVANVLFLGALEVLIAPLVTLMFQLPKVPNVGAISLALALGVVGYAALGTLVGAMLSHVRLRAILLPVVLFPLVIPVLGIGVTVTGMLLADQPEAFQYLSIVAMLDLILIMVSAWLFDRLVETL